MDKKVFDSIADRAFQKIKLQYESEIEIDTKQIKSDEDFFAYVETRIEIVRAHSERYADELANGLIKFYENSKSD